MSDVIVINQALRKRERGTPSVKTYYTVDIQSEPLVFNLNPKDMGTAPALAIASTLRTKVKNVTAEASVSTMRARKTAAIALANGKPWAVKRYKGRGGIMPPTLGPYAFNDSGRLAASIVAQAAKDKWVINVAANRLDPSTGDVTRIWSRLVSLVPEFANHRALLDSHEVAQAFRVGLDAVVAKAPMSHDQLSVARARALLNVAAQVLLKALAA